MVHLQFLHAYCDVIVSIFHYKHSHLSLESSFTERALHSVLTLCQTEDVDLRACGRRIIREVYHHVKYLCWWMEWLKRSPLVCTPTMS